MSHVIRVGPAQEGWCVEADGLSTALMFCSGGRAEAAARDLASAFAAAGEHSEVRVFLRDGSLAGRYVCAPEARSEPPGKS